MSIFRKIHIVKEELKALISSTDSEERAYQKYITGLKDWDTFRNAIIGEASKKDGLLKYYKNKLKYFLLVALPAILEICLRKSIQKSVGLQTPSG